MKQKIKDYDVVRQTRYYSVFDALTQKKVIKLLNFFERYIVEFKEKKMIATTYYDTKSKDLEKSAILLYRTTMNKNSILTMAQEKSGSQSIFLDQLNSKSYSINVDKNRSVITYADFLRNSFKNMFISSIAFDPDNLMKKLVYAYSTETESSIYSSVSGTGLKVRLSFDTDAHYSYETKRKVIQYFLTIEQLSNEKTDEDFEDLNSKLDRYCKELSLTEDSKISIARRLTRPLPKLTKEQIALEKAKLKKSKEIQ